MLPITPFGCGCTNARPEPNSAGSDPARLGRHPGRRAARRRRRPGRPGRAPRSGRRRARGCTPKSLLIASCDLGRGGRAASSASAPSSSWRSSSEGKGSARKAARWRATISCELGDRRVVLARCGGAVLGGCHPLLLWLAVELPHYACCHAVASASVSTTAVPAALSLVPSQEETLLREAVGGHLRRLRTRVHAAEARRRRTTAASCGTPSRRTDISASTSPRSTAGAVLGMTALSWVGRGDRCGRLRAASDRGLTGHRRQHPGQARDVHPEGTLAARHRKGNDENRLRDHRGRRGQQLAQPGHLAAPRQRALPAQRPEDVHLRRRGCRRRACGRAHPARRRQARAAVAGNRRRRRSRIHAPADPDGRAWSRQAVDPVLRRRRARGGTTDRGRERRPWGGVRRPQPRAHHGCVHLHGHRSPGARDGPPPTRASDGCGDSRSAHTRAWPTRWPRRRSNSSSRA